MYKYITRTPHIKREEIIIICFIYTMTVTHYIKIVSFINVPNVCLIIPLCTPGNDDLYVLLLSLL